MAHWDVFGCKYFQLREELREEVLFPGVSAEAGNLGHLAPLQLPPFLAPRAWGEGEAPPGPWGRLRLPSLTFPIRPVGREGEMGALGRPAPREQSGYLSSLVALTQARGGARCGPAGKPHGLSGVQEGSAASPDAGRTPGLPLLPLPDQPPPSRARGQPGSPGAVSGLSLDRGWGWGPPLTTFHWFLSSHPGPDQATSVCLSRLWLCAVFMTSSRLECPPRASPTASSALPY